MSVCQSRDVHYRPKISQNKGSQKTLIKPKKLSVVNWTTIGRIFVNFAEIEWEISYFLGNREEYALCNMNH